jgi:hypothetical protein
MIRGSRAAAGLKLAAAAGMAAAFMLTGPGQAAPAAPNQGSGQACLFSAPYGVIPTGGLIGHTGWGYQDGTGSDWTFGATEGNLNPLGPDNSWMESGTFAEMLNAFGNGTHYSKGPGYYLQYRCTTVADSNPSAALATAQQEAANGYNLFTNNCLTKSVTILQAYNVPNLPNVPLLPPGDLPNYYFDNELPTGFGSVQYFTTLTIGAKIVDPLDDVYLTTNPLHTRRPMRIQMLDSSGNVVYDSRFSITATVTPGTDRYQATAQLPSPSPIDSNLESWSGSSPASYTLVVQLATTPGDTRGLTLPSAKTVSITQAAANTAPDILLFAGDINGDGYVNDQDYQLLLQCFNDLGPPKCDPGLAATTDLDDDGQVNGTDYNELLRVFAYLQKING